MKTCSSPARLALLAGIAAVGVLIVTHLPLPDAVARGLTYEPPTTHNSNENLAPTNPSIDELTAEKPNAKHTGWWARETLSDRCIDSVSPSELIKLAASLKEPFSTVDHLDENGDIAGVTLTMPTENSRFVFYRSRGDCTAKIQGDQQKVDDLASKYQ